MMQAGYAIGSAQTVPLRGDVAANVAQHRRLAEAAASEGVRLLCFPELSLTGYELELGPELAFATDDARLVPLMDAAARYAMTLVVGAPVRIGRALYIGAFALLPDRTIELYTKRHLGAFTADVASDGIVPPPESDVFQPGTHNPVFKHGRHNVAMSICADSRHDSHAATAAELGASIYLSCQFAIPAHLRFKLSRLKAHARQHGFTVVFANYGGPTGGLPGAGSSGIWSSSGERLVRLGEGGLGVAVAIEDGAGIRASTIDLA